MCARYLAFVVVLAGLVLQTRGIYLAFGGFWVVWRSKRAQFFRRLLSVLRIWETFAVYFYWRLLSVLRIWETFAGKFYGVCGRFCLGLCLCAQVHNPRAARASRTQSRAYLLGRSLGIRQRNHASAAASASKLRAQRTVI